MRRQLAGGAGAARIRGQIPCLWPHIGGIIHSRIRRVDNMGNLGVRTETVPGATQPHRCWRTGLQPFILETAVNDGESPQSLWPPGFAQNPQQTLRVGLRFRVTPINPSLWTLHPPSTAVFRFKRHGTCPCGHGRRSEEL